MKTLVAAGKPVHTRVMQVHAPRNSHLQQWARGIAFLIAMIATPIVLALIWLLVIDGAAL